MNRWTELLLGLILLLGVVVVGWFSSVYGWTLFGKSFDFLNAGWVLLKGGVFWVVFFIGLFLIILGINDLRD